MGETNNNGLVYVDKDGNIARVQNFTPKMVGSLRGKVNIWEQVSKELKESGFERIGTDIFGGKELINDISNEMAAYKKKIEEQIKQKKAEEFDF